MGSEGITPGQIGSKDSAKIWWRLYLQTIQTNYTSVMGKPKIRKERLCRTRNIPLDVFYCDEDYLTGIAYAKSICRNCPAIEECLEYAMSYPMEEYGVWGGLTPADRKKLRIQEALSSNSLLRSKRHEQEHPTHASPFSPSDISVEENHIQPVLLTGFAAQLLDRVGQLKLSQLLQPEELSSGPSRKILSERLLDALTKSQEREHQPVETEVISLRGLNLSLSQIPEPTDDDLRELEANPIPLISLGQFLG